MPELKKCLIANRGEIAVRIIRACKEVGIATVAVYSEADARAKHVRLADVAVPIGEASPTASYLNIAQLIAVAQDTNCDCVHPGYGFLSESEAFARAVMDAGRVWVGPAPETIALMGVKTEARARMQNAGVPLVPGFQPDNADTVTDDDFISAAETIGYPLMVKAAGGGGGKGIRVVDDPSTLKDALASARREAQNAFGDARVFLEKYIEHARHIEVQIIADTHGNTLHLYERECSTQRRHQKIIEESPSPLLDDATRRAICDSAVTAAEAVGYVNAGTVEFIATPAGDFYFLEMNTRLQVEHPVTEMVTGVDLVQAQFAVAGGQALPFTQAEIAQHGHAIECRIYAEDAHNNFLPAIGTVHRFSPPEGAGIRMDSGLQSGDDITIHYDPMIGKLITHGRTRDDAINRMRYALQAMVLLGTTTNVDFLLALLETDAFLNGTVDTGFVDAHLHSLLPDASELPDVALLAAALHDLHMQNTTTRAIVGDSDGDVYSPWARTDTFRL